MILALIGNRKVRREGRHLPPMNAVERRAVAALSSVLVAEFQGLPGVHEVILLPGENIAYLKVDPERFHNESLSNMAGIEVR